MLLRGLPFFASCIPCKRATGMKIKLVANHETEPKFKLMPFLPRISFPRTVKSNSITLPESANEIFLDSVQFQQHMSPTDTTDFPKGVAQSKFLNSSFTGWDNGDLPSFSDMELAFLREIFRNS